MLKTFSEGIMYSTTSCIAAATILCVQYNTDFLKAFEGAERHILWCYSYCKIGKK